MSGAPRRALLLIVLAAALPATALAQHPQDGPAPAGSAPDVVIDQSSYDPARMTVVLGEPVSWLNASIRTHTVTSKSGRFDSGQLGPGRRFGHTFTSPGSFGYFCRIHPFMEGTIDVATLLLHPVDPLVRGEPLVLGGRGRHGGGPVTIEQDAGAGFTALVTVPRAMDGRFAAHLTAQRSATFRAVSGADVSAPVHVEVAAARTVTIATKRGRKRRIIRAGVKPAAGGSIVHLQRHLRERFGWWTVARRTLNGKGVARFSVRRTMKGRVRVVLTQPDGETPLAVSRTMALRG